MICDQCSQVKSYLELRRSGNGDCIEASIAKTPRRARRGVLRNRLNPNSNNLAVSARAALRIPRERRMKRRRDRSVSFPPGCRPDGRPPRRIRERHGTLSRRERGDAANMTEVRDLLRARQAAAEAAARCQSNVLPISGNDSTAPKETTDGKHTAAAPHQPADRGQKNVSRSPAGELVQATGSQSAKLQSPEKAGKEGLQPLTAKASSPLQPSPHLAK